MYIKEPILIQAIYSDILGHILKYACIVLYNFVMQKSRDDVEIRIPLCSLGSITNLEEKKKSLILVATLETLIKFYSSPLNRLPTHILPG
jgi:hypothetical protein